MAEVMNDRWSFEERSEEADVTAAVAASIAAAQSRIRSRKCFAIFAYEKLIDRFSRRSERRAAEIS